MNLLLKMSYRSGGDIGVFLLRLNKVMSSASRRTKHLENTDRDGGNTVIHDFLN